MEYDTAQKFTLRMQFRDGYLMIRPLLAHTMGTETADDTDRLYKLILEQRDSL
jgi:hypothetical protein